MKPILLICCCAGALLGCGGDPALPDAAPKGGSITDTRPQKQREPRLRRAHCAPALSNCRAATGRIVYIEAVDPDGDGDAHFVLTSTDSVTSPGLTVIDVERRLRPKPLPRVGDRVAAAGPVYRGSYGQRQIEAVELHVARAR